MNELAQHLAQTLQHLLQISSLLAFPIVLFAGILTGFTPCVYPILPVTIGFIGGQSRGSRSRAFLLSVFYVLGMAIAYSVLGAAAALSGKLFGQIASSPLMYFLIGNMCFLMGMSMLGIFTLRMPSFLSRLGPKKTQEGFAGSFIVGVFSGLVVSPCTAPVLFVLLGYVGVTGNIIFGFSLLFTYAVGMGLLMLVAGTFAGFLSALPKSGMWMQKVEKIFGWILIAAGEYFIYRAGILSV